MFSNGTLNIIEIYGLRMSKLRLKSRISLITGGSGGFGIATCERFTEEGSTVILADINEQKLNNLTTEYQNRSDQIRTYFLDVSNFTQVESVINKVVTEFGRIDILVNNAGYLPKSDNWLEEPIKDWQEVINVNLSGEYFCARAVAKQMIDRKQGRIINISSSAFRHGGISGGGGVSYTSSKAGVIGLTRSLAKALGPYNITVNAIAPGPTLTPMTESWLPQKKAKLIEGIPLGRIGSPSDVANAALFLASDEASFITGTCLDVNGGLTMS